MINCSTSFSPASPIASQWVATPSPPLRAGDSPALAAADAELEAPANDANLSPLLAAMMLTLADTIAANNAAIASALEFRDRLAVKRLPFDALIRPLSARSGRV